MSIRYDHTLIVTDTNVTDRMDHNVKWLEKHDVTFFRHKTGVNTVEQIFVPASGSGKGWPTNLMHEEMLTEFCEYLYANYCYAIHVLDTDNGVVTWRGLNKEVNTAL